MHASREPGEAAERIQELYLARRKDEAGAAVPDECIAVPTVSPVNPALRSFGPYRAATDQEEAVRFMAELAGLNRRV